MFLELAMKEQNGKITLPLELQKQMIKFFLKTSIPRKKHEQEKKKSLFNTTGGGK